jgi:alpha-mannosidase
LKGTYTTHAHVKKSNRASEILLRQVELFSTISAVCCGKVYPRAEIDRLWKLVLLNQFHDVLPGSSIEMVYVDAWAHYKEVLESGTALLYDAINACSGLTSEGPVLYNSTSWTLQPSVITVGKDAKIQEGGIIQESADGKSKMFISSAVGQYSSKILKVVWPVDVNNDVANYDSQFGYVSRPTTRNNSWEMAKFEVCGHKWIDLRFFLCKINVLVSTALVSRYLMIASTATRFAEMK